MQNVLNYAVNETLQNIEICHDSAAKPAILILYISIMAVFLIGGLFLARKSPKYWAIFFLVLVLGGIITTFLVLSPNSVQFIYTYFNTPVSVLTSFWVTESHSSNKKTLV